MSLQTDLYSKLYLARRSEIAIKAYYYENEMKTPMHMSYGQEIAPVGVCHALSDGDQVFGSYRSHALYLAKSGDVVKFFGEMYGKMNGIVAGKGGSMHLSDPSHGYMGASAVVAAQIPMATGTAFAQKYKNQDFISVPFFGDGAIDEGDFWESVNIATSKRLPVLFILEHNGLAVNTPPSVRHGYDSICKIMRQFRFAHVEEIDVVYNPDVEVVYHSTVNAIDDMKERDRPGFLCIHVERGIQHVGVESDYDGVRRKKPDAEDNVSFYRRKLVALIGEEEVKKIEIGIDNRVEDAIVQAKKAEFPTSSELYKGVFA
jgi:TPP-dependent pyruvate/acetoin dehydrogenase alpha subunit